MFASKDVFLKSSGSGGYTIARSVRLRSSANAYLNRTPAVTGNRKTWTWSGWTKRGNMATGAAQFLFTARSGTPWGGIVLENSTGQLQITFTAGSSGGTYTSAFYRDPSAWYHIVVAVDTTQATAADRVKVYVNGVQVTSFSSTNYPVQNFDTQFNSTIAHYLGCSQSSTENVDGYMTEVNFIDGAALTPSSFGATDATTGVWQPKQYTGTYGTNGFYLNFSSNSTAAALGTDFSGNSNTWTVNNISVTAGTTYDSMTDVPTLTSATVANYCVLNPIFTNGFSPLTLTNGNLTATSASGARLALGTMYATTDAYYFEATCTTVAAGGSRVGIRNDSTQRFYDNSGNYFDGATSTAYGATYTTGDVIGVAFDLTNQTITFYKNNTSQGQKTSIGLTGILVAPFVYADTSGVWNLNFGQRPFTYTAPSGFVALNTYNLSTPTIPNGAVYMAATTYTGTGASLAVANTVNGTAMQPDWVWVKGRSGATDHALYDVLRGTTKQLESNTVTAETTESTGLTAFGSTGFTVDALAQMNTSAATYVAWQWKANGAGVTNTSGSITSTVSANTTAGFSIVLWTGNGLTAATVGHGLGVVPAMIICKERTGTDYWHVKHQSTASNTNLFLNVTNASTSAATVGDGILADLSSSTTFGFATAGSPGNVIAVNENGITNVAYVFAAVAGYSAFDSYTGNGSTDGPFVFLGFRPRFIFIKSSSRVEDWHIMDTSRSTFNKIDADLYPNLSNAEAANNGADILSNGFKLRSTDSGTNFSGATYIYMAFAENPFKYSLAR